MSKLRPRRDRLERLLHLVRVYRGWTQRRMATELERDPHNLVPAGGIPRLDLVLRMSDALDWPIESVVRELCSEERLSANDAGTANLPATPCVPGDVAWVALMERDWDRAIAACQAARQGGATTAQMAYSYLIEFKALEFRGRYTEAVGAAQAGLRLAQPESREYWWLQGYLASAYYLLGSTHEAMGLASTLLDELDWSGPVDAKRVRGLALSVRGHCRRVLASTRQSRQARLIEAACDDLRAAARELRATASSHEPADLVGASICEGGLLELDVLREVMPAATAVQHVLDRMGSVPVPGLSEKDWAESIGWWCVFGCHIVIRHMIDSPEAERLLAIFTNKADQAAATTENWALRERVWTIEHLRRRTLDGTEPSAPWVLDREDLATLTGVMGRFPAFREVGWSVLSQVELADDQGD